MHNTQGAVSVMLIVISCTVLLMSASNIALYSTETQLFYINVGTTHSSEEYLIVNNI